MQDGTNPANAEVVEQPQEVETEVGAPTEPGNEPSDASDEVETNEASEASEGEQESAETDEPSVDEWLESLTPNERAKYAKRYPTAWKALQDPNQPEDMKQLLRDKINSDFELRNRKQNQPAEDDEPTVEEEEAEEEQPQQPQKMTPEQRAEWTQNLQQYVAKKFDADAVKGVGDSLLQSLGYAKDQYKPEVAKNFGNALAVAAVDLFNTMLSDKEYAPALIQAYLPQQLHKVVDRETWSEQWQTIKESNETYAELPEYGTKEWKAANEQFKKAHPWYAEVKWTPQAQAKALAQYLSGQKVTPPAVKKAYENGKKDAEQASRSAKLGKLGAGKPTGQFAPKNQGDDFRSAIERYNQSQRSTGK